MGQGQPPARHAAWLALPQRAMSQEDVATAGLETINIATSGILEPIEGAKTQFVPLLQSSEYAMPFEAARFSMLANPGELMRDLEPDRRALRHRRAHQRSGAVRLPQRYRGAEGWLSSPRTST